MAEDPEGALKKKPLDWVISGDDGGERGDSMFYSYITAC